MTERERKSLRSSTELEDSKHKVTAWENWKPIEQSDITSKTYWSIINVELSDPACEVYTYFRWIWVTTYESEHNNVFDIVPSGWTDTKSWKMASNKVI